MAAPLAVLLIAPGASLTSATKTSASLWLQSRGFTVTVAGSSSDALPLLQNRSFDLAVIAHFSDASGIEALIEDLRIQQQALKIIVISDSNDAVLRVRALRAGAFAVLDPPFDGQRFDQAIASATARIADGKRPAPPGRTEAETPGPDQAGIGSSAAMSAVRQRIAALAGSMASAFITGESGTGKELAALALHAASPRRNGPFIALNCGAIPHDLLESEVFGHLKGSFTGAIADRTGAAAAADGGTLFLDEICELAPALQTKLLRFLETSMVQPIGALRPRRVDVRIICATNQDPLEAVRKGLFREDLYYRLHVVPLHLPPLRARDKDAIEIATMGLERFAREEGKIFDGFTPAARDVILACSWPGNIRQLLNVMQQIAVISPGGPVRPEMLPAEIRRPAEQSESRPTGDGDPFRGLTLAEVERRAIEAALQRNQGSVQKAAHDLHISLSTLYRRIEAWRRKDP